MSSVKIEKGMKKDNRGEGFIDDFISTAEGKRVLSCIQCGTCTATCPVQKVFEHSPRQLFLMVRNGQKNKVLSDMTPWVCASCFKCTVNCPAQIKITEVMYKLKRMAIQNDLVTKKSDTNLFYKAFMGGVKKYGRSYEMGLMLKYYTFNHPMALVKQMPLGMKMMLNGSMPVMPHKVAKRDSFQKIIAHAMRTENAEKN
jgi:heterodisulfide reductase subunit C